VRFATHSKNLLANPGAEKAFCFAVAPFLFFLNFRAKTAAKALDFSAPPKFFSRLDRV
jgi:hypothetical protein